MHGGLCNAGDFDGTTYYKAQGALQNL